MADQSLLDTLAELAERVLKQSNVATDKNIDTPKVVKKSVSFDPELEIVLKGDAKQYNILPVKHLSIWNFYKKAMRTFWTPEEIELSRDIPHWNNILTDVEREFVGSILAFFAISDGIVNDNLLDNFMNTVNLQEARAFYSFQIAVENIHSEVYNQMLITYIQDEKTRNGYFNAIENMPAVKLKAEWAIKWINSEDATFVDRLIAFAAVEGIFFSGSFAAIFWLQERNLMPGLTQANEFIARDEGLHCDFACHLYHDYIKQKLPVERVKEIILDAVEIEKNFLTVAMPCKMIGMNCEKMKTYIECVADHLLFKLIDEKHFNSKNPFPFMERIAFDKKTNFFEHKVSEYAKPITVSHDELIFDSTLNF